MKRAFDIILSSLGLIILLPLGLLIAVLIKLESDGPVFFSQMRMGKNLQPFAMYKFRTMHTNAEKGGLLTVGKKDRRITKVGYWLRNYKLDELPQLWNVLKGDMSLVGPRPEVAKYVAYYNDEQKRVFSIRPGITDWASIAFRHENELIEKASDPEDYYIKEILPAKLALNLAYLDNRSFFTDLQIIMQTVLPIGRKKHIRKSD